MADDSHLDRRYFLDTTKYNCPFCKRRHVAYRLSGVEQFDWTDQKPCFVYFVICGSCKNTSMHLSFTSLVSSADGDYPTFQPADVNLDAEIFYSVPSSFFVLDARIPAPLRELIAEAEASLKMNFLTGASACTRKAIYELLVHEQAEGRNYEDRIKSLKTKYPQIDATLFDVLAAVQEMTSDKIHEQSWPHWDSRSLVLILETVKAILSEIYVVPAEKAKRLKDIQDLRAKVRGSLGQEP